MASEEVEKPIEEMKVEATSAPVEPAASEEAVSATAVEEPKVATETTTAAPPVPPADPMKQMGDAANQVGASVDKAMSGMTPQNRFMLVAVVSVFIAGIGDILNGQVMKGVVVLLIAGVLVFMAPFTFLLSLLVLGAFHVIAAIDAIAIASRISKGEKFGEWDFFIKPPPAQ